MRKKFKFSDVRAAAWQSAIQLGDQQLRNGEGIAYTAETVQEITQSAIDAISNGHSIDPDILPYIATTDAIIKSSSGMRIILRV